MRYSDYAIKSYTGNIINKEWINNLVSHEQNKHLSKKKQKKDIVNVKYVESISDNGQPQANPSDYEDALFQ